MKSTGYLLIGGGVASGEAAKQIRQKSPEASITLVGQEGHRPYDRPPLSKEFLRGEKSREELVFDPEEYFREQNIDLVLGAAVGKLDLDSKTAVLDIDESIRFEKALIATGGRPVRLEVPGGELEGVHYLRTLDDSEAIAAEAGHGKRAVIVGAGFIGMEVAASLAQRGVQVSVIEPLPHIWPHFADPTLARYVQDHCSRRGVSFHTGETVAELRGKARVSSVVTGSGMEIPCDFVCVGIGIVPNVELAERAGLEVDNGIVVNEYLQSSHPDVYAAGDVANYVDPVFGKRRRVEHWGHAEYCGQLAGLNMTGAEDQYRLMTYVWSDIFDLHLEFAGDESEYDQVLTRGRLEDDSFTVLYLKQNVLRAYFAVNTASKEFPVLQRLIRRTTDLGGKVAQVQDPKFNIRELL